MAEEQTLWSCVATVGTKSFNRGHDCYFNGGFPASVNFLFELFQYSDLLVHITAFVNVIDDPF